MTRTCPHGHTNSDADARFCSTCGTELAPEQDVAPTEPSAAAVSRSTDAAGPEATVVTSTKRRAGNPGWIAAGVAAVLIVAAVLVLSGAFSDSKKTRELTGIFVLYDILEIEGPPTSCRGTGGYDDFRAGMGVTVRNGEGTVMATSSTRYGSKQEVSKVWDQFEDLIDDDDETLSELLSRSYCVVFFELDVADAEFYDLEVGRRGTQTYSRSELDERDWHVEMTLGQ